MMNGAALGQGGYGPGRNAGNRRECAASRVLQQNQTLAATAAWSMSRTPGNLRTYSAPISCDGVK